MEKCSDLNKNVQFSRICHSTREFSAIFIHNNISIAEKKYYYIILLISVLVIFPTCIPIRHYAVTRKTQKWEKEHFNPERTVAKKKKNSKKSKKKTKGINKRIG